MMPAWSPGRVLYAVGFTVALPLGLVVWARALDAFLDLPAFQSPLGGSALAAAGVGIWLAGVAEIVRRGRGLPMNAYPPERFVTSGVYRVMAHPIYAGWIMACAGVAWAAGSAAGLWVVTPTVALGCLALVYGLERPSLRRRFGAATASFKPWLSLPPSDASRPSRGERFAVLVVVFVPWMLAYSAVKTLGVAADAIDIRIAQEKAWPVLLWTVPVYVSAYVVVPLAAYAAPTRAALRRLAEQGLTATVVISLVYLVVPVVAPFRPFDAGSVLGRVLALDQALASPPVAAWPAFHVVWAAFAAGAFASRSRAWAVSAWIWAAAVAVSCVTTGMHALADIPAAAVFAWLLWDPVARWRSLLNAAERLANSWRATRLGPVRIMNHGVYAGAAGGVGMAGLLWLLGASALPAVASVATGSLVGAGLWAQWADSATRIQRPFGYYGGVIGGCVGAVVAAALGQPVAPVLAATAVMAPWIQALGRLRCLAQGCCHGAPVDSRFGIRVVNAHSRVVSLSALGGQPIHATPVYSIVGNLALGPVLWRLWQVGAPAWFICGAYLMLTGLLRFVEEAYRGEPQTRRWLGLPIYQPLSLVSLGAGLLLTWIGGAPVPEAAGRVDAVLVAASAVTALIYWLAMGVDFPESHRRFARLSG